MFRNIAIAACFASALMMVSAPANAAAYFIGGKWYFFSLDFEAAIAKMTGKDLKTGTYVKADVNIVASDVLCVNPQTKFLTPGKGPQVRASGLSPSVKDADLTKDERYPRNTFITTAVVELSPPAAEICKTTTAQGSWKAAYWQNKACNKGADQVVGRAACYSDLAVKEGDNLVYVTNGNPVPNQLDWTIVYLPTNFEFTATLVNNVSGAYDVENGACQFGLNNENSLGLPYGISNPPVDGWSQPGPVPVYYVCQ
ncbi:MAG: hypothetical protein ABIN37_04305 [Burkholderiaceae bacterium]